MGNEWGKNPQKMGIPFQITSISPRNSFVSSRITDFFIASDSFPAIQESMVTPKESTKARKMKQI